LLREKPMLFRQVASARSVRIAPITRNPGGWRLKHFSDG
jgi:hypothetical protein